MFDFMGMMGKVKEAQAKIKEAQAKLVHLTAEGESGAGLVKVLVNGERKVLKIQMDDSLLNPQDKEMLTDLIVAATNKAMEAIEQNPVIYELMMQHTWQTTPVNLEEWLVKYAKNRYKTEDKSLVEAWQILRKTPTTKVS